MRAAKNWPVAASLVVIGAVSVGVTQLAHASDTDQSSPPPAAVDRVEVVAAELQAQVLADDEASAKRIEAAVKRGLPPGAAAALLEAVAGHPRLDLMPALEELASYRRAEVRGRAFVALASFGGIYAFQAISKAADDTEPGIRRLAYALSKVHPGAGVDEVIAELLEQDAELAAEVAGDNGGLIGDPQ